MQVENNEEAEFLLKMAGASRAKKGGRHDHLTCSTYIRLIESERITTSPLITLFKVPYTKEGRS